MQKRKDEKPQEAHVESGEPIGIVISRGSRAEEASRFAAFVWSAVPDAAPVDDLVAVA